MYHNNHFYRAITDSGGEYVNTFIQILIAILLAYVAWQNYKINKSALKLQKDKLRLDLLDRRIRVFEACQDLFFSAAQEGRVTREALNTFNLNSSNAEFLFGREVEAYIKEIREKGLKSIHLNGRLQNQNLETGETRNKFADELFENEGWFVNQLLDSKQIFRKYLHFSVDKEPT